MKKVLSLAGAILLLCATFAFSEESKAINKSPFSFLQGFVMGDDYVEYQSKLQKIEDSYKSGKISKDQYLQLRSEAAEDYRASKEPEYR